MQHLRWNPEKGAVLKRERGVSFEQVVVAVESGGLLDILAHPDPARFPNQRILIVNCDSCACLVPFVEEEEYCFLKTVIPSRKATRDYLTRGDDDAED